MKIGYKTHDMKTINVVKMIVNKHSNTTHTTHNRFTAGLEYVRVHPGQQVPER